MKNSTQSSVTFRSILVLACSLLLAPTIASGSVVKSLQEIGNPAYLASPLQRLLAIGPLVALSVGSASITSPGLMSAASADRGADSDVQAYSRDWRAVVDKRAAELNVNGERLRLWHDLFMHYGTPGLLSLRKPSIKELVKDLEGTWALDNRIMQGRETISGHLKYTKILELTDRHARVQQLRLDSGVFHSWLDSGPRNDESFTVGLFGEITYTYASDGDLAEYGLEPGEDAIVEEFEGELFGPSYELGKGAVPMKMSFIHVKQGNAYNAVRSFWELNNEGKINFDFDLNTVLSSGEHVLVICGASVFDGMETYVRLSKTVELKNLARYWARAKKDSRLLHPKYPRLYLGRLNKAP